MFRGGFLTTSSLTCKMTKPTFEVSRQGQQHTEAHLSIPLSQNNLRMHSPASTQKTQSIDEESIA